MSLWWPASVSWKGNTVELLLSWYPCWNPVNQVCFLPFCCDHCWPESRNLSLKGWQWKKSFQIIRSRPWHRKNQRLERIKLVLPEQEINFDMVFRKWWKRDKILRIMELIIKFIKISSDTMTGWKPAFYGWLQWVSMTHPEKWTQLLDTRTEFWNWDDLNPLITFPFSSHGAGKGRQISSSL